MNGWAVKPLMEVIPLKNAMAELARHNGKMATKTSLALCIQGEGTLWRAMDCVERVISSGYAEIAVVKENEGRTQRFELRMTDAGWAAARRMGIEVW